MLLHIMHKVKVSNEVGTHNHASVSEKFEKPIGVHIVNKLLFFCLTQQSLGTNLIKVGGICHSVTILPILYI